MHVLLKEPAHPDSQRKIASGFAAAQTIVANENSWFVPCMISAPEPKREYVAPITMHSYTHLAANLGLRALYPSR